MFLQSEDKTVLFAVGSTLVNCTNSYDVEKPDPQMVELAKYAKQHVPEEHPKVILILTFLFSSRTNIAQYLFYTASFQLFFVMIHVSAYFLYFCFF